MYGWYAYLEEMNAPKYYTLIEMISILNNNLRIELNSVYDRCNNTLLRGEDSP